MVLWTSDVRRFSTFTAVLGGALVAMVALASPAVAQPEPLEEQCGLRDFACRLRVAVIGAIADMITETLNQGLFGASVGLVFQPPPGEGVLAANLTIRLIVNAAYIILVTVGGILMMTHHTVHTIAPAREMVPRIALGWLTANLSLTICEIVTDVGNGLSLAIMSDVVTPDEAEDAINRLLGNPLSEIFLVVLLMLIAMILQIFVVFGLFLRVMIFMVLTAVAPLALACYALPHLDGVARLWWRAIGAVVATQVGQALVFRVMIEVFFARDGLWDFAGLTMAQGLIDMGVLIASLYFLMRIPFWAFKRAYANSPLTTATRAAMGYFLVSKLTRRPPKTPPRRGRAASLSANTRSNAKRPARWEQRPIPGIDRRIRDAQRRTRQPQAPDPQRGQRPIPGIDREIASARHRTTAPSPPVSSPHRPASSMQTRPGGSEPIPPLRPALQGRPVRRRPRPQNEET